MNQSRHSDRWKHVLNRIRTIVGVHPRPATPPRASYSILSSDSDQVTLQLRAQRGTRVALTIGNNGSAVADLQAELYVTPATQRLSPAPSGTTSTPVVQEISRTAREPLHALIPSVATVLFLASILVYLLTRVIGLEDYPIFFFTDEAVHTNLAADFLRDHLVYQRELFPTYFQNGPFWNLGTSVYLQILPYLLFGKSVFVTRFTSVLVTLVGVIALALMLKQVMGLRLWWLGVLLLSITPAWFLHSRTAFETAEMTALYAVFLYCYGLYRKGTMPAMFATVIVGALAYNAYSPGQLVMLLTALALAIVDWRYHWQHRFVAFSAAALGVVVGLPLLRFQLNHPGVMAAQLAERGSLLVRPVPLSEKLSRVASEYLTGLNPAYWFLPNERDLTRHLMQGYGHILIIALPFFLLGIVICVRQWRSSWARIVVIALLAAPAGGALAEMGVTRALPFVIPATLLTAIGAEAAVHHWARTARARLVTALSLFVALSGFNVLMLLDALENGPTWSHNYGLYGMQWGGRQMLGGLVPTLLRNSPEGRISVTPNWANGTNELTRFFLTPEQSGRVLMRSATDFLDRPLPLSAQDQFIVLPNEYDRLKNDPKFKEVTLDFVLPYPDGSPGFHVVRMEYVDNVAAQFELELAARRQPVREAVTVDGAATITHSRFGTGRPADLFDGDSYTLVRGEEANPIVFDLELSAPRSISAVTLTTGTIAEFTATIRAYAFGSTTPIVADQTFRDTPPDPTVTIPVPGLSTPANRVTIELQDKRAGGTAQIHVREIRLVP